MKSEARTSFPEVSARTRPILALALGNDILGDDAVGPLAARALEADLGGRIDVLESGESGLALLEMIEGYERVLILDAIVTGGAPVGALLEFSASDFSMPVGPSPHYAALPEVWALARRLDIPLPGDLRILTMEIVNPLVFSTEQTPQARAALPAFVARARAIVEGWLADPAPQPLQSPSDSFSA